MKSKVIRNIFRITSQPDMQEKGEGFYRKPYLPNYDNEDRVIHPYYEVRIFCVFRQNPGNIKEEIKGETII